MSAHENQMIRFGVMGPGRAASRFAQGVAAVEGAEIAAVWGRNAERAADYAAKFSVARIAPNVDALLRGDVDAVYVATHPDSHAELCIAAFEAGKHVLCEKPAALNVRQVERVIAAALR